MESETDVDVKDESVKADIGKKVARIIKKLEAKLKRVDDKIKQLLMSWRNTTKLTARHGQLYK